MTYGKNELGFAEPTWRVEKVPLADVHSTLVEEEVELPTPVG